MSDYQAFLESKRRRVPATGRQIKPADLNPMLHEWQQRIVIWAAAKGRAAIFADCGLGKTFMQLEWASLMADRSLIVAPLSVARQTVNEASKLDMTIGYVRHPDEITGDGVWITNYEMVEQFDAADFGAVVLDESSILKNVDGSTRRKLTDAFSVVPYRLACTATPAPNDVAELCNHAEWLGILPRVEMLAAYFVHDDDGWRLKKHAVDPMHKWMAGWAVAVRHPGDIGGDDSGYDLPPVNIESHLVDVPIDSGDQLFATDLGGVGGRAKVRRETLLARAERAVELARRDGQWIVWCGLNDEASSVAAGVPGAVNVEGSWDPDRKADALEAFQDGDIRVLVTKPSIAGFGMNFQNCHQMVFLGMNDSYETYYQAIRRCHRFGQPHRVDVHVVVSELEQQIVDNVRRKESTSSLTTQKLVEYSELASR